MGKGNQNPSLLFGRFFQACLNNIESLIQQGFIDPNKMAVGGLSRGAYVAAHLAAKEPRLKYLLGFAPMVIFPGVEAIDTLIPKLVNHQVRFYIGNHDLRVGTEASFIFIHKLADAAYQHGHRSPPMELIISPSIGYKGHGTLPLSLNQAANGS
ncbi:MAG: hypothetical protein HWD61_08375 [Parachlamydiaceae bacterium]|nr:MAG: hypothetical protein HWD61_08375 [Parachlamydiaceae bacterium]